MLVQTIPISRGTLSAKCLSRSDRPRFSGGHERIGDSAWLLSRNALIPRMVEIGIQEGKPEVHGFILYKGLKDREVWCPISDRSVFLNKVSEGLEESPQHEKRDCSGKACLPGRGTVPGKRMVFMRGSVASGPEDAAFCQAAREDARGGVSVAQFSQRNAADGDAQAFGEFFLLFRRAVPRHLQPVGVSFS